MGAFKYIILLIFIIIISLTYLYTTWVNPGARNPMLDIRSCIYKDHSMKTQVISSMGTKFKVSFVEQAGIHCINPYFPTIHVTTEDRNNAWLHIVRTNAKDRTFSQFIDAPSESFPFYTYSPDFYDAPHWTYTLWKKPLTIWVGSIYALAIDRHNKTICCKGGIRWGFTLSYFKLRPRNIQPSALGIEDWLQDSQLIHKELSEYNILLNCS